MSEAITLICAIAIIGPALALAVMGYNINRQLKGLPQEDGGTALLNMWKEVLRKLRSSVSNTQANSKVKSEKVKTPAQSNVEDAEFYEKKS